MKILVTGCAGFIGTCLCKMLVAKGLDVVGIDNFVITYDSRVKQRRLQQLNKLNNFHFLEKDITDQGQLHSVFNEFPIGSVVNLAAHAGIRESIDNPNDYFQTNTIGVINLLEECKKYQVRNFIQISTSSIYGDAQAPFKETYPIDKPLSPYAASKTSSELICYIYSKIHGINVTILRLSTVYGIEGRPDMSIFRFVHWIIQQKPVRIFGGDQARDYIYVDDVAHAIVLSLNKSLRYANINIGSGSAISLQELVSVIESSAKLKANIAYEPANPADSDTNELDISKAEQLIGWKPTTSVRLGIEQIIEWYRENSNWIRTLNI